MKTIVSPSGDGRELVHPEGLYFFLPHVCTCEGDNGEKGCLRTGTSQL